MVFEKKGEAKTGRATWTGSCAAVALLALWEMERDESLRTSSAKGLRATAEIAVAGIKQRQEFDAAAVLQYDGDWRKLNALWKPQQTINEAGEIAAHQLQGINRLSPARRAELRTAREAMFAAWVVTLCPDRNFLKQHEPEIATLAHFRADKLRFAFFFTLECAWWRLQVVG